MSGRYLYVNHIRDDVLCPECGASAVKPRSETIEKRRISYAMLGTKPRFVYDGNALPTNVTLYGDCECGAAVKFLEPGDVSFFLEAVAPAQSGATPLFDNPESAKTYRALRRENPQVEHFTLALLAGKDRLPKSDLKDPESD